MVSFEPAYLELEVEPYTSRSRVPVVTVQTGENEEGGAVARFGVHRPFQRDGQRPEVAGGRCAPRGGDDSAGRSFLRALYDSLSSVIELQDAQGNAIVSPLLRITNESITVDSVRVDVHVYPTKQCRQRGKRGDGRAGAWLYAGRGARYAADRLVAGDAEVLAGLDVLHVASPLDVSGQSVSQLGSSALSDVETLVYRAAEDVIIEAQIVQAEHVHTYQDLEITVMNLDPSLTAKLSRSSMSAVLSGSMRTWKG